MPLVSRCSRSVTTWHSRRLGITGSVRRPWRGVTPRLGGALSRADGPVIWHFAWVLDIRRTTSRRERNAPNPNRPGPGPITARRQPRAGDAAGNGDRSGLGYGTQHRGVSRRCDGQGRGSGTRPDRPVGRNHVLGGTEGQGGLVPGADNPERRRAR